MYSAFDSPYPHIPAAAIPIQRKRSPNFLESVKHLVKRPSSTRLEAPKDNDPTLHTRSTSDLAPRARQRSHSPVPRFHARSWGGSSARTRKGQRSREQIPSMIDYLTLAQLENVWYKQDSYKGTVSAPQPTPSPEVERMQQSQQRNRDLLNAPSLDAHPAIRARGASFDESTWSRPPAYRR
ncbi:MAG: hypothetical protein L6R40_000328 [Gallowayella cf. fulva]|nr:MAG: hypothetical protein L6R40_000328 [Xanthomendoza cf. fulva]